MTATQTLIDTLKQRASAMAKPFIEAARQPDATELQRAIGEAAQLILRDAETRAKRLPRDEFERRVASFNEWHRRHEARMRREVAKLTRGGFAPSGNGALKDARRRATAELANREAEFDEWLESHALAAWIRATEDLLTLERPSAFIASQQSPSRH